MKKLITILSTLTITSIIIPTIVACTKKETKELDLNSLTADSFKQLDTMNQLSIETKNINDIKDDETLIRSIKDHIKVMILKKVFGLNNLVYHPKPDEQKTADVYYNYWVRATPSILNVNVKIIEPNKKYEITIKKEKLENIKIDTSANKNPLDIIKPYYDRIKGEETKITVNK